MPQALSLVLRYLHQQQGECLRRLQELYPQFSRTTIYRHMKKPITEEPSAPKPSASKKARGGRPTKATDRYQRKLVMAIHKLRESEGDFSSTDIQREAGISEKEMSNRTLRRHLHRMGYGCYQCRRKGVLSKEDLTLRVKFAKKCKRLPSTFWKEGISFYLDGVSFVHKTNPSQHARTTRTRTWRKKL